MHPTSQELDLLAKAVDESGRHSTVQLTGAFAYAEGGATPLATLLRLGEPAMKVYLTFVLATREPPHEVYRSWQPARLARMLGFDDSDFDNAASAGTRRVQRAFNALERADPSFITRRKRPGRADLVTVNHFDEDLRPPYLTLPISLWQRGWINVMSVRALAVYIALRRACAGKEQELIHVTPYRLRNYGLSDDTLSRGATELQGLNLLKVTRGTPDDREAARRQRRLFQLTSAAMNTEAPPQMRG